MEMIELKEGAFLPAPCEGATVQFLADAFICIGFLPDITEEERTSFSQDQIDYGLYIADCNQYEVPFFTFSIKDSLQFALSLNLPAETKSVQDEFIVGNNPFIPLLLCDYPSGEIKSIRIIDTEIITKEIRKICQDQLKFDGKLISDKIMKIMDTIYPEQMIEESIFQGFLGRGE